MRKRPQHQSATALTLRSAQPLSSPHEPSSSLPSLAPEDGASRRPTRCQICWDSDAATLVAICGRQCPAVVCPSCFETHIHTTLETTITGILPRIRCPVCLTQMPKAAWRRHVPRALVKRFQTLCAKACAFLPPCCHDGTYTQLPKALTRSDQPLRFESVVDAELHPHLPRLRATLTRFVAYESSARDLVRCIDDIVQPIGFTPLSLQEFVDVVAVRVRDDERRAALILAFHATHKHVVTRCCCASLCFHCARTWDSDHDANPSGPCDREALTDSDMVSCRACRVTLVKVEGCDDVTCPCGFAMRWSDELDFRDDYARGRIPTTVDRFDLERFRCWDAWRRRVATIVRYEIPSLRAVWRRDRVIACGLDLHRALLRRVLSTYIWRRRFRLALPEMTLEIHSVRRRLLVQRLRRAGFSVAVSDRVRTRVRWRRCFAQLKHVVPTYDEDCVALGELQLVAFGLFDGM